MMGLLGSLGNIVKKGLDTLSGIVTNPITAITKGTAASTKEFVSAKPLTNVAKTLTTTAVVGAGIVGAGAALGSPVAVNIASKAAAAAKAVTPVSLKGKIAAALAVPIVAGAVATKPAETAKAALNAPSNLANFGGNIAKVAADPSISSIKTLAKENPILTAATGIAVVGAIGLGTAGVVSGILNTQAVKENTKATKQAIEQIQTPQAPTIIQQAPQTLAVPTTTQAAAAAATPVTPETAPLLATAGSGGTTTSKRRKKRSSKPVMQNFKQNVNVIVANRANSTGMKLNKRYINKEVLAV